MHVEQARTSLFMLRFVFKRQAAPTCLTQATMHKDDQG